MTDQSTLKTSKKRVWPKIIGIMLLVLVVVYAVFMTVTNRNLVNQRDQRAKQDVVVSQLPGQACGVLSPELAKSIIGVDPKQTARNARTIAYEDGCTYSDPSNSNRYASLVIKTFTNQKDASDNFAKERSLHIDSQNRDPAEYGDEMYYSSGTFYVLRGNQTISTGASKEGLSETQQEEFSRQLLDKVIKNI